ncbi:hypothetical protein QBC39DRAFT_392809 [Podospora conica]|nr:hypothetical protein QBC39DRAFT_392809 [Schizothecium conicum]
MIGAIITGILKALWTWAAIKNWWKRPPKKRPPLLLTRRGMLLQLSCQLAIIITLLMLLKRSDSNKGIATVQESDTPSYDEARGFKSAPIFSSKIVWATVPAWIISAYSALWSAMLDALMAVHTDIELNKKYQKPLLGRRKTLGKLWQRFYQSLPLPSAWRRQSPAPPPQSAQAGHSTAKRTILLDYGEWPILNGFKAFRTGHIILGFSLILRAGLWSAGGLSAAIFDVADVPFKTSVTLHSDAFFDEFLGYYEGDLSRQQEPALRAFDVVSATLIRGGQNLSWTTGTHSFLPYLPSQISTSGNYTFDTEAYWASIQCNYYTGEKLRTEGFLEQALWDPELGSAQIRLHYSHAGCEINKWFNVFNHTEYYARSFSTTECGLAQGRARLGFFTGRYREASFPDPDGFLLTEMVIMTCKPDFHRANVTVTVSISDSETPGRKPVARILHFEEKPGSTESLWPYFFKRFIDNLPIYNVGTQASLRDVDSFGRLVIDHASDRPRLDYIPMDARLPHSFEAVFRGVYSNYVSLMAYSDAPRREVQGTLAQDQVRLFVVYQATYAVVAIVAAALLTTLFLAVYLVRNRDIIRDHQELMLGTAFLLRDVTVRGTPSGVGEYLDAVKDRAKATPDVNLVKVAEQHADLNDWEAWVEGGVMRMENPRAVSAGSTPTVAGNSPTGLGPLSAQAGGSPAQSNAGGIPLQNIPSGRPQLPNP